MTNNTLSVVIEIMIPDEKSFVELYKRKITNSKFNDLALKIIYKKLIAIKEDRKESIVIDFDNIEECHLKFTEAEYRLYKHTKDFNLIGYADDVYVVHYQGATAKYLN